MGKRILSGKISLVLFGMLNLLMVLGPAILPAYRGFVKMQYARIWRNRMNSRRNRELITIHVSQREFDRYREGNHEIWLGNRLYDIEEIKKDKAGIHLRVEYDQEETMQLDTLSKLHQKKTTEKGLADISARWLQWLSELVPYNKLSPVPVLTGNDPALTRRDYASAILHRYGPVDQQPPDDQMIF